MKVFELIKELEKHDPNLEVALFNQDDWMRYTEDINLSKWVDWKFEWGIEKICHQDQWEDSRWRKLIEESKEKYLLIS